MGPSRPPLRWGAAGRKATRPAAPSSHRRNRSDAAATGPRPVARWWPGALLALGDVELDGLAVLQRATVLDSAGVDEDVVAGLGLDEAVALVGVEPFGCG